MSCFGATPAYYSPSSSSFAASSSGRPWRWWRARCAGIAAAVGARLRRSLSLNRRMGGRGTRARRRSHHTPAVHHHHAHHRRHHHHHRSFAPVYVDDLYAHQQYLQHPQPASSAKPAAAVVLQEHQEPSTSGAGKLAAASPVRAHTAAAAAAAATRATAGGKPTAGATRPKKPSRDVMALMMRSPGRGGGVLCGGAVVKGMGEVDLRAELFIRKFKEDMRLQSQRSAEEFQAMLARGL